MKFSVTLRAFNLTVYTSHAPVVWASLTSRETVKSSHHLALQYAWINADSIKGLRIFLSVDGKWSDCVVIDRYSMLTNGIKFLYCNKLNVTLN